MLFVDFKNLFSYASNYLGSLLRIFFITFIEYKNTKYVFNVLAQNKQVEKTGYLSYVVCVECLYYWVMQNYRIIRTIVLIFNMQIRYQTVQTNVLDAEHSNILSFFMATTTYNHCRSVSYLGPWHNNFNHVPTTFEISFFQNSLTVY